MRILHTADLHLGKRLYGVGLEEDQRWILQQIADVAVAEQAAAVLLAGDVFDRMNPPASAVSLLDDFFVRLRADGMEVFVVAGNHDSPERLDYAARLLNREGVHIAGVFREKPPVFRMEDEHGAVFFHLLPYVRPGNVRDVWQDAATLSDGIRAALADADPSARNVLVSHQFALPASGVAESAEPDVVDAALFSAFDYAALGHIHSGMRVGLPMTRYAGAPLAYSTDEAGQTKTVSIVDLQEKGNTTAREIPLRPLHPLRRAEGELDDILRDEPPSEDYLHIRLTNRDPVLDAMSRLRSRFPNLLRLEWTARSAPERTRRVENVRRDPLELYAEFFRLMNGRDPTENELSLLREAGEEAAL